MEIGFTHIDFTLTVFIPQFRPETVNALTPAIENIDDLQRLEQLLIAASEARNIESFAQILQE